MSKPSLPRTIPSPLTVYYDGACMVCSREMQFYAERSADLRMIDISAEDFDCAEHGRTSAEFMEKLHARDAQGEWYVGTEAFRAIWRVVPGRFYDLLAMLLGWPVVRSLASWGYRLFARYRHLLPRKKSSCGDETCRRPRI